MANNLRPSLTVRRPPLQYAGAPPRGAEDQDLGRWGAEEEFRRWGAEEELRLFLLLLGSSRSSASSLPLTRSTPSRLLLLLPPRSTPSRLLLLQPPLHRRSSTPSHLLLPLRPPLPPTSSTLWCLLLVLGLLVPHWIQGKCSSEASTNQALQS